MTSGGGRPAGLANRLSEPNPIDRTAAEDLETVRALVKEELEAAHGVESGRRRPFLVRMGDVDSVVAPVRTAIEELAEPEAQLGRDQQVVPDRDPLKSTRERMQCEAAMLSPMRPRRACSMNAFSMLVSSFNVLSGNG